jgi:hypothetical protein
MSGDLIQKTSVMLSASWWNFSSLSRNAFSVDVDATVDRLPSAIDATFGVRTVSKWPLPQIALDDRSKIGGIKRLLDEQEAKKAGEIKKKL